jgi:hypothetical protein
VATKVATAAGLDFGLRGNTCEASPTGRSLTMLWTILIVLAIIALVLFILGRMRGRRGV